MYQPVEEIERFQKELESINNYYNQKTMNKNYEKSLASGEGIFFKDGDGDIILIGGADKDASGNYRCSEWSDTKEDCLQHIGRYNGYLPETLENKLKEWTYAGSVVLAHGEPVEAGTKVRISENAKEECEKNGFGWDDKMDEMVGKVCEVKKQHGSDYHIWNEDKTDYYTLPRTAFVIAIEEEDTKTDESKTLTDCMKDMEKLSSDFFAKADEFIKKIKN